MKRLHLYYKSIIYSIKLVCRASGYQLVVLFILSLIATTLTLFSAYPIKYIIDALNDPHIDLLFVFVMVILYIFAVLINYIIASVQNYIFNSVSRKAEHIFECEINNKMCALSLEVIDSSKGKTVLDDVRYAKHGVIFCWYDMLALGASIYSFLIAFIVLIKFNVKFSIFLLLFTIPGIILREIYDKKAEALRLETAPDVRKFSYYRWMLTDAWPSKDVRMYDLTDPIKIRYKEEKRQYLCSNKKLDKKKLYSFLFAEIVRRFGEIIFIVFIINQSINAQISIGDIALYTGFVLSVSDAFSSIVFNLVMGYARTPEIMERFFKFWETGTEQHHGGRNLDQFESLTFDNVYFKYPYTDRYVLKGVSFSLSNGDKLSIVGINGSGKSTIIKLMLGLYEIESGQILINGYPMSDYDIRDVRKLFSALFQSFVQYPLTLRENIALSSLERIDDSDEIESVLRQSGVYEDIKPKLENGLDSFMTRKFDDKGTELSKGQWQKIALSRAYFKNAPIIIFDEPSAALDAEAEDRIFKNFESISDGKTGIMISHRISSARMSNKIIVLDGGKITEQGTHKELVSLNGLYAKLYNLQREKYTIKEGD